MSVLTNMMDEREGWAARHRMAVVRRSLTRIILDNALLITVGLLVYTRHQEVLGLIRTLLH
jgi:hypothetical protein